MSVSTTNSGHVFDSLNSKDGKASFDVMIIHHSLLLMYGRIIPKISSCFTSLGFSLYIIHLPSLHHKYSDMSKTYMPDNSVSVQNFL